MRFEIKELWVLPLWIIGGTMIAMNPDANLFNATILFAVFGGIAHWGLNISIKRRKLEMNK